MQKQESNVKELSLIYTETQKKALVKWVKIMHHQIKAMIPSFHGIWKILWMIMQTGK